MPDTRRDSLKLLVAIGAGATARAQDSHLPDSHASDQSGYEHSPYKPPAIAPYSPKTFSAAEGVLITRIVDLIIPATDTPGAVAAGVPEYVDNLSAAHPARRQTIVAGLGAIDTQSRALHGKPFIELAEEQQAALLTNTAENATFFRAIKDMTIDGYYGSYTGLVEELGYRGNQMLASFPGCTHDHER